MVKKGQLEVSKMDSPKQGEQRDPQGSKPKRTAASGSGRSGSDSNASRRTRGA